MSERQIHSRKFSEELTQAGLAGAPLSWTDHGTYDITQLTPEKQTVFLDAWEKHDPTTPMRREEADALLLGGLTLVNSGALDGTYHISGKEGQYLNSILTSWNNSGTLPNNQATVEIVDADGTVHNFDKGAIQSFALLARDFVHNCELYVHSEADSLPANSATITVAASTAVACSVYSSTAQDIPANTDTKIMFDTAEYDVTLAFDLANNRFQPTVDGYYQINCGCGVAAGTVQNYTSIFKNGVEYRRSTTSSEGGNTRLSTLVHLNGTTDYVEGFIRINKSFSTIPGGVLTSFSAALVQSS